MRNDVIDDLAGKIWRYREFHGINCNPDIDRELAKKYLYGNNKLLLDKFLEIEFNRKEDSYGFNYA